MRTVLLRSLFLAAILCCGLGVLESAARAQENRIAVLDMQRVQRDAEAVRGLQEEIERRRDLFQNEFREREEQFRKQEQRLSRERKDMTVEEYETRRTKLQQEAIALEQDLEQRRRQLDEIFRHGMEKIRRALAEIVTEISTERGLDLVVQKSSVVVVRSEVEITDEALLRLNERLPMVEVQETDEPKNGDG